MVVHRRAFLHGVAATGLATGLAGCSFLGGDDDSGPDTTQRPAVIDDDFGYATDQLSANGWSVVRGTAGETVVVKDSTLAMARDFNNCYVVHDQPRATGRYEFRGVASDTSRAGHHVRFLGTGDGVDGWAGYFVGVRASGLVTLDRRAGGTRDNLATLVQDHGGEPYDFRIDRVETESGDYRFTCEYRPSAADEWRESTVEESAEAAVTESAVLAVKMNVAGQAVDAVTVRERVDGA